MLALTGTPRHVELEPNTMIVTSGHGGVFPRGIPIGTVAAGEGRETSWQRNYLIRPSVSPSEMTYVLVLGAPQGSLAAVDLARAWGIREREPVPVDTSAASAAARAAGVADRPAPRISIPTPSIGVPARPEGARVIGVPVGPRSPADSTN